VQSLEVREDYSSAAHRFFALARLFMCHHPIAGAAVIARCLGDYQPYRPGWNFKSGTNGEHYVWIGAGEKEGRTTKERPEGVPDADIYHAPPEPPFSGSDAHGFFNRAVSGLAVELGSDAAQTDIFRIHHDVLRAAGVDLNQLDEWSSQIAQTMQERVRMALQNPQTSINGLLDPAKELVSDYLAFSVPGNVVRDILSSYLVFLIDLFPSPSVMLEPPAQRHHAAFAARRVERLVSLFTHLRERAGALLFERKAHDLPSFYEMTYLAVLLGDVGLMIGRMLLDRVRVSGELRKRILRNQRMLDEELAHFGEATFLYPALFCEFIVPGELRIIRKTPRPEPFVYPQLDGVGVNPLAPANVFRLLRERTTGLPRYDVRASLDERNRLLDGQNLRELTKGLLFLTLGRGLHDGPGNSGGDP
jgi:hypothetical protein